MAPAKAHQPVPIYVDAGAREVPRIDQTGQEAAHAEEFAGTEVSRIDRTAQEAAGADESTV
jgi:hypothetical protein